MERWKPISGYEGLYEVSDLGNVRALRLINRRTNRLLDEPRPVALGWSGRYFQASLSKDNKRRSYGVHTLVLSAFVGQRLEGQEGAHLDGNSKNNCLPNLAWVTHAENERHKKVHGTAAVGSRQGSSKLTEAKVLEIRALKKSGKSHSEIANQFGINQATVGKIVTRKSWRALAEDDKLAQGPERNTSYEDKA